MHRTFHAKIFPTEFHQHSVTNDHMTNTPLSMLLDLQLHDRVRLRKPHPCGSYEWLVVRLGADIGLECMGCKRRILLPRRELARRLKTILPRSHDEPLP